MENRFHVRLEAEPTQGDMEALVQGLTEFNAQQTGGETPTYLIATVRDQDGGLLGGLLGGAYLGWLHIQVVWLGDNLRGQGYGSELMAVAEREAVRLGCQHSFVETLSFQALPFYEKCGYTVHSTLQGCPPGGTRYSLTKVIGEPADS